MRRAALVRLAVGRRPGRLVPAEPPLHPPPEGSIIASDATFSRWRTAVGDQRWQQLRTCLADATIPLAARASGVVALLYGAALSQVLLLHVADVATISGRCHLRLGQHPVLVPPAIARLLRDQAAAAATQPTAPETGPWLFPGQPGLRPITSAAILTHLNHRGIQIRAARTAALIDLVGQLPPAVLASLLGLAPSTAERWSRRIASDWATYLHARNKALEEVVGLTGDSKTDSINRAIQIYAYIERVLHSGGSIYVRETPDQEPERLKIF